MRTLENICFHWHYIKITLDAVQHEVFFTKDNLRTARLLKGPVTLLTVLSGPVVMSRVVTLMFSCRKLA